MLTSGSSPSQKTSVSVKWWCSACIYYWNPYSNRQTWKTWFFFHRYQCDLVTGINRNTFSGQAMLFGAFLMKNIFIIFQLIFWTIFFPQFRWKFHDFSSKVDNYVRLHQTKHMKSIGFLMKSCKKYSSKYELENDENIFHQKCTKHHCLVTESVSILCLWRDHIDACEKNQVFSCLLITVGIPIVNACTIASLYRNACLLWGRGAGSKHL